MANIITELHLEMSANWYVTKKLNSIGRVGENTVTKLIIEPTEILDNVTYEIEIMSADGSKNVAELTVDGTELYLILTANMLTTSGITKMQVRGLFTDGSIKKSNIFELKVNRSISATDYYEEYAVTIFDQLVQDCRDIIEGAESYAVRAETAATNAEAYSESASTSAEAASASEATASTASTAAVNAAASAENSATSAHTSAETATTAASSASASATSATTSAQTATNASTAAQSASEAAQTASNTATSAATSAENSATSASTAANNASTSATAAANSATAASTSATSASASATSAVTSETNAASSEASAANSATSASTSATNAANSAVAAATSATNAHASEVNASASETNASTSAAEAEASAESIAASVAQINENTYRINDLEAIIGGYQLTDLPTGAIASITDGTALLMPSLKIGIEPAQDLHGYDHPWAGGAGKNLFDIDAEHTSGTGTYMYEVYVKPNTSYTLSTNCPYSSPASLYFNGGSTETNGVGNGTPKTFNSDEEGKLIIYVRNAASGVAINLYTAVKNGQYYIQLEEGSTATSYSPYSNICPISGWTAANIGVSPTTDAEDGTTYTIEFRDGDNPLTVYGGTLDVTSGELVVDRAYKEFDGTENWTRYATSEINTVFILYGILPNSAIPINPRSSQFNWNSRAFEVASGREYTFYLEQSGAYRIFMQVPTSVASTNETFKTWLATQKANNTPVAISVKTTPSTYHLTPTQIRTLVGNNNIWADTGDIIEGKYYRSPF